MPWRLYLALTKPRVVALIVLTAVVGTLLSTPGMPPLSALLWGNLGIALAAACAATLNQVLDQRIDARMARTRTRPLPTGGLTEKQALAFALVLGVASMLILWLLVNHLTALLTFASLIGYAVVYTLLFLIIFAWTPPHFWALAIARRDDYAKVDIPMLPVTHGVELTRLHVLLYTVILILVTLLPWLTGMSGLIYLAAALVLNAVFLWYAIALKRTTRKELPMKVFKFSVQYLMWLFIALLVDHYVPIRLL
jgi:heme o synthase